MLLTLQVLLKCLFMSKGSVQEQTSRDTSSVSLFKFPSTLTIRQNLDFYIQFISRYISGYDSKPGERTSPDQFFVYNYRYVKTYLKDFLTSVSFHQFGSWIQNSPCPLELQVQTVEKVLSCIDYIESGNSELAYASLTFDLV